MSSFIFILVLLPLLTFVMIAILDQGQKIKGYLIFTSCIFIMTAMSLALLFMMFFIHDPNYQLKIHWDWLIFDPLHLQLHLTLRNIAIVILFMATLTVSMTQMYIQNTSAADNSHYKTLALQIFATVIVILTDNILIISIFWFLISFCSFFGYLNHNKLSSEKNSIYHYIIPFCGDILFLIALLIIYSKTLTFSIAGIAKILQSGTIAPKTSVGWSILIMVSILLKGAHFPFHFWFKTALKGRLAKSYSIQFLGVILVPVYILFRLHPIILDEVLIAWAYYMGIVTLLYFIIASIQSRIRELIQFSFLGHSGLIILGLAVASKGAAFNYLVCFMLFSTLFCLLMDYWLYHALYHQHGKRYSNATLTQLAQIPNRSPFLSWIHLWMVLLIAGIPLTITFIAKIDLYSTILQASIGTSIYWVPFIFALFASIFSVFYIARLHLTLIYIPNRNTATPKKFRLNAAHNQYLALSILSLLGIYFFLSYPHLNPLMHKSWIDSLIGPFLEKTRFSVNPGILNLTYLLISILSLVGLFGAWFIVVKNPKIMSLLKNKFSPLYNLLLKGIIPEDLFSKAILPTAKRGACKLKEFEDNQMHGFPHLAVERIIKKVLALYRKTTYKINKILSFDPEQLTRPVQYLINSNLIIVIIAYLLIIIIGLVVILI